MGSPSSNGDGVGNGLGGGRPAGAGRQAEITIVGGGIAGMCAAIACAEEGARVRLLEAHQRLGGRARSTDGPYKANLGPHAFYSDGGMWTWMQERGLLPAHRKPKLSAARMRIDGAIRRTPPLELLPAMLRLRGRQAPVEEDFRTWAQRQHALPGSRRGASPGRPLGGCRPRPGRLHRSLFGHRSISCAGGHGAHPGARADPACGERRSGGAAPGAIPGRGAAKMARAGELAPSPGDGRSLRSARHAGLHLAGSSGHRPWRGRLPRR